MDLTLEIVDFGTVVRYFYVRHKVVVVVTNSDNIPMVNCWLFINILYIIRVKLLLLLLFYTTHHYITLHVFSIKATDYSVYNNIITRVHVRPNTAPRRYPLDSLDPGNTCARTIERTSGMRLTNRLERANMSFARLMCKCTYIITNCVLCT